MNAQLFTDAMSELNDKYVMEAVSYRHKSKPQFNTWLSKVACVFLAVLLSGSAVLTFSVEARAAFFGMQLFKMTTENGKLIITLL